MFNVYSIENQNFYLNNSIISGVQGLDISYNNNINSSLAVEDSNFNYFISSPVVADLNIEYLLSQKDGFINFITGDFFEGKIEYGSKFFTFSSGYLTNYSLNYRLGEYPKVNARSVIFGELGNTSGIFNYSPKRLDNFIIGDNYYAELNLNEVNSNRLESFSIEIEIPREPVYTIGNYLPDNVIIKYPININMDLNFSMSEYDQEKVTNIFTGIRSSLTNIKIKEYNSNSNLLLLNLSGLVNDQSSINYSLNNDAKLNLNLKTQILNNNINLDFLT